MNRGSLSDWKYLRSIQNEPLEELSRRINDEVRAVLARTDCSENDKRGQVYDIVTRRDKIVAVCFDDWRRTKVVERCWALQKHSLLKPEHRMKLSTHMQEWIRPL